MGINFPPFILSRCQNNGTSKLNGAQFSPWKVQCVCFYVRESNIFMKSPSFTLDQLKGPFLISLSEE